MILGNNNNDIFNKRNNLIVEEGKKNQNIINMFQEEKIVKKSTDPTNKIAMADKSFAILQERYRNGLITIEEFNKKCEQLNKFRQNNK